MITVLYRKKGSGKIVAKARKPEVLSLLVRPYGVNLEVSLALNRMFSVRCGEPTVYTIVSQRTQRNEMLRCFSESIKWLELGGWGVGLT